MLSCVFTKAAERPNVIIIIFNVLSIRSGETRSSLEFFPKLKMLLHGNNTLVQWLINFRFLNIDQLKFEHLTPAVSASTR